MIFKMIGLHHPFFRPLIWRILTVLVIAIWGVIEQMLGNPGWAFFSLFLGTLCLLAFFIFPDPQTYEDDDV